MQKIPLNIKTLYKYFAGHPESSWIMSWPNALSLYRFVKTHNIKRVLDLGTGIGLSASVVALALLEKGEKDYKIDSIEQTDKCVKIANQIIPQELKRNLKIYKANVEVWNSDVMPYTPLSVFDKLPEGYYDLIINDGPGPFMENGKYIELPNGTVHKLLLEDKIKPGTFVVYDGRLVSLKLLERYFGHNFYYKPQRSNGGDFNIIERKDNPVECLDDKIPLMEQSGYFKDEAK